VLSLSMCLIVIELSDWGHRKDISLGINVESFFLTPC
jgi:hypothetical protein